MLGRRIIRIDQAGFSVAREARFESEEKLHAAMSAHTEAFPNEDFGLGTLVPLANELDLGSGPLDLLAADSQGRLAIVEFKKGQENRDVRQVVAQILDYGSSLWRYDYDDLEAKCAALEPGFSESLADYVGARLSALDEAFEPEAFRPGVEASLESGAFVFIYCARDLDARTLRIMTYLAEGPRMAFFGVEVDHYLEGPSGAAVLVPRTAFVPTWIPGPGPSEAVAPRPRPRADDAPPEYQQLVDLMKDVAADMQLQTNRRPTGWQYLPATLPQHVRYPQSGVGVYWTSRGIEFNLAAVRDLGHDAVADEILTQLESITGLPIQHARLWPSFPCAPLLADWPRTRSQVIEPYFRVRGGSVPSADPSGH